MTYNYSDADFYFPGMSGISKKIYIKSQSEACLHLFNTELKRSRYYYKSKLKESWYC